MINTLKKELRYDGKMQEFELRFTVASQLKFKKKYGNEGIQTILKTLDDLEMMLDFFTEALSFKDNQNPVTDGAKFYDLLVDNGYSGQEDFSSLVFEIASCSGIIKSEQSSKLSQMISDTYDSMFESLLDEHTQETTSSLEEEEETTKEKETTFRTGE